MAEARQAERVKRTQQQYNKQRDESDSFYGTERWRRLSIAYRRRHPLCCECERLGRVTPAKLVDHIKPRKLHPELSLDWGNLRSLCLPCHNAIGAKVRRDAGQQG